MQNLYNESYIMERWHSLVKCFEHYLSSLKICSVLTIFVIFFRTLLRFYVYNLLSNFQILDFATRKNIIYIYLIFFLKVIDLSIFIYFINF